MAPTYTGLRKVRQLAKIQRIREQVWKSRQGIVEKDPYAVETILERHPTLSTEEKQQLQSIEQGIAPVTGQSYDYLFAHIFDRALEPPPPGVRSLRKPLRKKPKEPHFEHHLQPRIWDNPYCEFRESEAQERWKAKLARLEAEGKSPKQKAENKRATRKK
ncbi:hypothetical protein GpartN1_g7117.t1 [Galdieria partita]|uniref:Uncharacterized protein n=1 Tax=Galdieria partita TaxID=83374 RepID=A0A9C7Q2L6_9RHOD|nr:hypothetical protein GpartN1_g6857.t1 [Galdieria partita]GJQ15326.1 hypothetical protein GpartN1_g7117.t1 [Galdieria partita]